jgi:pSer/pThr/pTyr-binding forkhead associated (FHA) protein
MNVSREHFQIEHNGTQYVLVDRQSTCGTLVEGQVVGGKQAGGAVPLRDGDVIIVGTSASRFAFKFRAG